jgi:hypothetical protein
MREESSPVGGKSVIVSTCSVRAISFATILALLEGEHPGLRWRAAIRDHLFPRHVCIDLARALRAVDVSLRPGFTSDPRPLAYVNLPGEHMGRLASRSLDLSASIDLRMRSRHGP